MKFRSDAHVDYSRRLKTKEPLIKEIPFLLKGEYYYRITLRNPYQQPVQLNITISEGGTIISAQQLETTELIYEKELLLTKTSDHFSQPLRVTFLLKKGNNVSITLPVGPIMASDIQNEDHDYEAIAHKIESAFENKILQTQHTGEGTFVGQEFQMSVFKDCITLAEAEKQLEFIVYNKLFIPDNSKGFIKWKRGVYRKIIRSFYRRLTKNTVRKQYMAKLYRNYINNSIISDNLEKAKL